MRISESQLRRVVVSEVEKMNTRSHGLLSEQYTPGVKAADGSITWKDASAVNGKQWSYSWNPKTGEAKTALVGQPLAVVDKTAKQKVYAAIKTQGERAQMEASAAPAATATPGSPGCSLPAYKDSLTTALAKTALAGYAAQNVIDLIIFGSFYKLSAEALAGAARVLRTTGGDDSWSGMAMAAVKTAQNMMTLGGSEAISESLAGLFDGLSLLISGTTSARIKFSRDCNLQNLATGMGAAFSSAISSIIEGVKGGIQSVITFFTTDAAKALGILQTVGLATLGITIASFTAILNFIAAIIKIGANAVQSAISSALLAAGAVLTGAGAATTAAGKSMAPPANESRRRIMNSYQKNVKSLAHEMNEAAKIEKIMSRLDERTRKVIISSMLLA